MPRSALGNWEHKEFMRKARAALLNGLGGNFGLASGGGGYTGGGYTGGATGPTIGGGPFTMTSGLSSAAESQAFNEKIKNRALYGKYGKGGLEREKMGQETSLRERMEQGATKRAGIAAGGVTGAAQIRADAWRDSTKMQQEGLNTRNELLNRPGDAFNPPGVNQYNAETQRMFPRQPQPREQKDPKVYPAEYGLYGEEELAPAYIVRIDPNTGVPYKMPIQGNRQNMPFDPNNPQSQMQRGPFNPNEAPSRQNLSDKKKKKKGWEDWRSYAD